MNVIKSKIEGLLIIEPKVYSDSRGYFFESFNEKRLQEIGINTKFIQDNQSGSSYGVIRGLHYQLSPYAQSKLVRVLSGEILDVCVDIRENSPTFGSYEAIRLSSRNQKQLFVPKGFAHGFSVLSESATVMYKTDAYYHPESERGIAFDDPALGIDWQIKGNQMVVSDKDRAHPTLSESTISFKVH